MELRGEAEAEAQARLNTKVELLTARTQALEQSLDRSILFHRLKCRRRSRDLFSEDAS